MTGGSMKRLTPTIARNALADALSDFSWGLERQNAGTVWQASPLAENVLEFNGDGRGGEIIIRVTIEVETER